MEPLTIFSARCDTHLPHLEPGTHVIVYTGRLDYLLPRNAEWTGGQVDEVYEGWLYLRRDTLYGPNDGFSRIRPGIIARLDVFE